MVKLVFLVVFLKCDRSVSTLLYILLVGTICPLNTLERGFTRNTHPLLVVGTLSICFRPSCKRRKRRGPKGGGNGQWTRVRKYRVVKSSCCAALFRPVIVVASRTRSRRVSPAICQTRISSRLVRSSYQTGDYSGEFNVQR